jgi:arginine N-succinyltransferase
MMLVRPIRDSDIRQVSQLFGEDIVGMTSIPRCKTKWNKIVRESMRSFSNDICPTEQNSFFMVLEDTTSGVISGTTAVYTNVGVSAPLVSFALKSSAPCNGNSVRTKLSSFQISKRHGPFTEVGSLYLNKAYRGANYAKLLTKSRYLLMASQSCRFNEDVIAELRGWQQPDGQCPFWSEIGMKFVELPFHEIDRFNSINGSSVLATKIPERPFYLDTLREEVRRFVAMEHKDASPARRRLEQEGFRFNGRFDVFDGGPTLECKFDELETIRNSKEFVLACSRKSFFPSHRAIAAIGNKGNFKCAVVRVELDHEAGIAHVEKGDIERLGALSGDETRIYSLE